MGIEILLIILIFMLCLVAFLLLKKNSHQNFLQIAEQILDKKLEKSSYQLDRSQKEVEHLVIPIHTQLKALQEEVNKMEKQRIESFSTLDNNIKTLQQEALRLNKETYNLSTALRKPEVRGKWGELQLKRVLEIAGMQQYCDFEMQYSIKDDNNKLLRPDVIVKMPYNKEIVIDSKVPLSNYLDAINENNPNLQEQLLLNHADSVKKRVQELSKKEYWNQFNNSPEFVVLFLPSENLFSSALDYIPELIEYGWENKVLIATPTTLIALLKAIAYGWSHKSLEDNAKKIGALGVELYERLATMGDNFEKLGNSIKSSVENYNKTIGSLESRVLVSARKFKDLGLSSGAEIKEQKQVEVQPRQISIKELDD
jgi:DNA recombination protein RmuC